MKWEISEMEMKREKKNQRSYIFKLYNILTA